jgi:hypothetical protein
MIRGCGILRDWSSLSLFFVTLFFFGALSLAAPVGGPAVAEAQETTVSPVMALVASYTNQGYDLAGPLHVRSAQPALLVVDTGAKSTGSMDLTGKTVKVIDSSNKTLTLKDAPGKDIYLLTKDNDLVIIVLPKEDRSNA